MVRSIHDVKAIGNGLKRKKNGVWEPTGSSLVQVWADPVFLSSPFDVAPNPTTGVGRAAFSAEAEYYAVSNRQSSPSMRWYKRNEDSFVKLSEPNNLPVNVQGMGFSDDDRLLLSWAQSAPFLSSYVREGDTLTRNNPAQDATGDLRMAKFSPSGDLLACAMATGTHTVNLFKRDGDNLIKQPNPANPGGVFTLSNILGWSPDGNVLLVGHSATPFMTLYERVGDELVVASVQPDINPGSQVRAIVWAPDGNRVYVATDSATGTINIYSRTGSVLTKTGEAATVLPGASREGVLHPSGDVIVFGSTTAPYHAVYAIEPDGSLSRLPDFTSTPINQVRGLAFSQDGRFMHLSPNQSPWFSLYRIGS